MTRTDCAHILVVGNEKGGSGKSTLAMHIAVAFVKHGMTVATLDLDARQGTLTRYMSHRWQFMAQKEKNSESGFKPLCHSPTHFSIPKSEAETAKAQKAEEADHFFRLMEEITPHFDVVVIDTPGSDNHLSRLAHSAADTILTPLNDSLIDLDMLARLESMQHTSAADCKIMTAAPYSQMVMQARRWKPNAQWLVLRNRVSHIHSRNQQEMEMLLPKIGAFCGFTPIAGLAERVIYRELFLKGLTVLDLEPEKPNSLTLSHLTARLEIRRVLSAINLSLKTTAAKHTDTARSLNPSLHNIPLAAQKQVVTGQK